MAAFGAELERQLIRRQRAARVRRARAWRSAASVVHLEIGGQLVETVPCATGPPAAARCLEQAVWQLRVDRTCGYQVTGQSIAHLISSMIFPGSCGAPASISCARRACSSGRTEPTRAVIFPLSNISVSTRSRAVVTSA